MSSSLLKRAERELVAGTERATEADVTLVLEEKEAILRKVFGSRHLARFFQDVKLLFQMHLDYAARRYRCIPWNTIAASATALLYVLNPMDLIPDFIPGIGYLDDGMVVMLAMKLIGRDLEKYRIWKEGRG
jgi:uncharacterized membrane protein YkvA (DUF1232 family)